MAEQNISYTERLAALRAEMARQKLDGFLVPRADEYQGENVPPGAERLRFLTGFTGSAGMACVLKDKAAVLTDGRYTLQLRMQADPALFECIDITKTAPGVWLAGQAVKGEVIGFDPWLHTPSQIEEIEKPLKEKGISLAAAERNPLDAIWKDRPAPPLKKAEIFPQAIAGKTGAEKRELIRADLKAQGADAAIITLPDSLAWLLNVRGGDIAYTPVVLSYGIVYADAPHMKWFVDARKISPELRVHLGNEVEICAPETIEGAVKDLSGKDVALDFRHAPLWFRTRLEAAGAKAINIKDPCIAPKAAKNESEIRSIREAHMQDGAAMVRFLYWLTQAQEELTELDIVAKLEAFRAANPFYRGPSFPTIAGFGPNGAIIHYRADEKSNLRLRAPGLLLLDSGGQYAGGTTDITRTLAIGTPSQEMRENYTRVLKGHASLSMAQFPAGTTGVEIDALARAPLRAAGLDYAHGTGHGVGCYLSVHEEAASISPRGKDVLVPGMLLSNEPGYYKEGEYGIRIENLVLVREDGVCADTGKNMLGFETMTMAPYDLSLIDDAMLSAEEKQWMNTYHEGVIAALAPYLPEAEARWLREQARPLAA